MSSLVYERIKVMASKEGLSKSLEKALSGAVSKVLSSFKSDTDREVDSDLEDFQQAPPKAKRKKKSGPCTLPTSFLTKKSGSKIVERFFTYDRDIICLPKSFLFEDNLIKIPRSQAVRDFLAANKLTGKIRITSAMSEQEIMAEIRSVFNVPMDHQSFKFQILQPSGGSSKSLTVPVQSTSFKWTASSLAGKNSKVPIYILAEDKLRLKKQLHEESEEENDLPVINITGMSKPQKRSKEPPKKTKLGASGKCPETVIIEDTNLAGPSNSKPSSSTTYRTYINLLSDNDSDFSPSPTPPPFSPFTPADEGDDVTLPVLLQEVLLKNLPLDRSENRRIVVRRKHLWADALHVFRKGIDTRKHLKVTFVGEPAVDDGGPLREFFHLLMSSMPQDNNLFCGLDGNRVPRTNVVELEKKTFFQVGVMIALSLVHGGPGPHSFTRAITDYITYGISKVRATPSDVPNEEIRQVLLELQNVNDIDKMRELLDSDEMGFRFSIGMSQPSHTLKISDRDRVIQSMATHYAVLSVKAELDQLIEGLKVLGVFDLFRSNATVMSPLLLCKKPVRLTSDYVIDLFKPCFSVFGSNQRESEEAVALHWMNYIQLIEDENGYVSGLSQTGISSSFNMTYETILAFATGCPTEPPAGFRNEPSLQFHNSSPYPKANTCTNTIHLPLDHSSSSLEIFVYCMSFGILNSVGFGRV